MFLDSKQGNFIEYPQDMFWNKNNKKHVFICYTIATYLINPCPAEPGYTLPL